MKYIFFENDKFGFKTDEVHEILDTDVSITEENYNKFFELQSQGKQFKIKNIHGITFEEIFEEIMPESVSKEPSELEKLKQENIEIKLALAEMYEVMLGGVV